MVPRALIRKVAAFLFLLGLASRSFAADWLPPAKELFRPFLADPKELGYQLRWTVRDDGQPITEIGLGDYLGIVQTSLGSGWQSQLSVGGGVIGRFDTYNHSRDFEVADFTLGLPFDVRRGPHGFRLAYWHISSHFGDDFIRQNPGMPLAKAFTDEVLLQYSFDPSPQLRLYGGVGEAFSIIPPDSRERYQGGFELAKPVLNGRAQVVLGSDLQYYARGDGRLAFATRLGFRLLNESRFGAITPFIGFYTGPAYYQQLFPKEEESWTLGVRFDMGSPAPR